MTADDIIKVVRACVRPLVTLGLVGALVTWVTMGI